MGSCHCVQCNSVLRSERRAILRRGSCRSLGTVTATRRPSQQIKVGIDLLCMVLSDSRDLMGSLNSLDGYCSPLAVLHYCSLCVTKTRTFGFVRCHVVVGDICCNQLQLLMPNMDANIAARMVYAHKLSVAVLVTVPLNQQRSQDKSRRRSDHTAPGVHGNRQ